MSLERNNSITGDRETLRSQMLAWADEQHRLGRMTARHGHDTRLTTEMYYGAIMLRDGQDVCESEVGHLR